MMKRLILPALVCLPLLASARPAYPGVTTVTNADGTTMQLRGYGDEHFSYLTDVAGEMIYEYNGNIGSFVPAQRLGRILRPVAADLKLLEAERTPVLKVQDKAIHRMAELDSNGRSIYPTTSDEEIPALVILVEFQDTKFTVPNVREQYDKMLNQEGYSDYDGKGSARDYYLASSNGKFKVHFDVSEVVPLSFNRGHIHGLDNGNTVPNRHRYMGDLIKEAIEYLDARGMDFSKYDLDGDGDIDNIFFYYAGYGQADSHDETTIWPHQSSYMNSVWLYPNEYKEIIVDGVRMRTYACSNELNYVAKTQPYLDGIGAFCHEYGHVLGLPDMYDTQGGNTRTPGDYTVMDSGSYNDNSTCPPRFSAYEQWVCNWLEYTDLEEGQAYKIPSMSASKNPTAYRLRVRRLGPAGLVRYFNEYFVFETRTLEGWDAALPEEGLFIWRIDFEQKTLWPMNQVNSTGTPCIELMSSAARSYAWPGKRESYFSCPGFNALTWSNKDNYNTQNPPYLTNIYFDKEAGEAGFEYNMIKEAPDVVTVLHDTPTLTKEDGTQEFKITWDAYPGATGYFVTMSRKSSLGSVTEIYKDYFVGNTTQFTYLVDTPAAWRQTFTASVRVLYGLPSNNISNQISFKPTDLSYSAVAGIDADDFEIAGGVGEIIAPEGAEVYNLSGIRTGKTNLAAGVYIVRYAGKAAKVVVK